MPALGSGFSGGGMSSGSGGTNISGFSSTFTSDGTKTLTGLTGADTRKVFVTPSEAYPDRGGIYIVSRTGTTLTLASEQGAEASGKSFEGGLVG